MISSSRWKGIRTCARRKNPYDDHEVYDEINVVPMLDLAWNLLLVFMIVVTASVQGISVNLPKASAAVSKIKPTTKAITITAEGTIYLDSFRLPWESWRPGSGSTRQLTQTCR